MIPYFYENGNFVYLRLANVTEKSMINATTRERRFEYGYENVFLLLTKGDKRSHIKLLIKKKSSTQFYDHGVIIMKIRCSFQQGEKYKC